MKQSTNFDGLTVEDTSGEEDITNIGSADNLAPVSTRGPSDDEQEVISDDEVSCISMKVPWPSNNLLPQLTDLLPSRMAPECKGRTHDQNKPKLKW